MKNMGTLSVVAVVSLMGCAENIEPVEVITPVEPVSESMRISKMEAQSLISAYVGALLDRDLQVLAEVVSAEVVTHGAERGIDLEGFLKRQRAALLLTFGLAEGDRPNIEVGTITIEGNAARVTLRFRDIELLKPFYVIRDDEGFTRLSIMKPGFSRSTRGKSTYLVENVNIYPNPQVLMYCWDWSVVVPSQDERSVTCTDVCGYWSGTTFQRDGYSTYLYCDWNSWGADAIINNLDATNGFHCNDSC